VSHTDREEAIGTPFPVNKQIDCNCDNRIKYGLSGLRLWHFVGLLTAETRRATGSAVRCSTLDVGRWMLDVRCSIFDFRNADPTAPRRGREFVNNSSFLWSMNVISSARQSCCSKRSVSRIHAQIFFQHLIDGFSSKFGVDRTLKPLFEPISRRLTPAAQCIPGAWLQNA
jgi:hypothetical protein